MGFFDRLKEAFGGGGDNDTKTTTGTSTGGRGSEAEQFEKNSAVDDVLMDLGLKDKNVAYYRDLKSRQDKSMSLLTAGSDDDGPSRTVTEEPEEEEEATDETTVIDIVAEVPEAPTTVRRRRPPPPPKPDPVYKGRRIEPPAGQTESEAMEAGQRGRKSTIATSPTGLLGEPEVRRRSLMGGLIS
jgi:hypothetical protein